MFSPPRKTNPGVKAGVVQKKNNATTTGDYYKEPLTHWRFEKQKPGPGFKHVLGKQDLDRFIEIVPGFEDLSKELDAIVLAKGSQYLYGRYRCGWTDHGIIHLCAWTADLHLPMTKWFYDKHPELIERLNLPYDEDDPQWWRTYHFTRESARALMLLDVFLHELGHHHDRVTTKSKKDSSRGEPYAEEFARTMAAKLWPTYIKRFEV